MDFGTLFNIVTILFAALSVGISYYTFQKTKTSQSYANFDNLYQNLLVLAMENPKFVNPKYTTDYLNKFTDEDQKFAYDMYAFMAWNICETIFDMKDEVLLKTWQPVLLNENKLHRSWFLNKENSARFKQEFQDFVKSLE